MYTEDPRLGSINQVFKFHCNYFAVINRAHYLWHSSWLFRQGVHILKQNIQEKNGDSDRDMTVIIYECSKIKHIRKEKKEKKKET